jgi:hypothetical protein
VPTGVWRASLPCGRQPTCAEPPGTNSARLHRAGAGGAPTVGVMRPLRYAAPLLALALTTGCGSGDASDPASSGPDPGASATGSPGAALPTGGTGGTGGTRPPGANATSTPGPVSPDPTSTSAARARPISILGTVSVRQGECLLFTPGDMAESWVLTGATEGLAPGKGYTLDGVMDDTPSATCPQGPVFIVTSAQPAG